MTVTPTYIPLATTTLGSTATSVTFGSIPATYRDLILVINPIDSTSGTGDFINLRFNGDTGSNYSRVAMIGNGSAASTTTRTDNGIDLEINGTHHFHQIQIMDYSASDKHKTALIRLNLPELRVYAMASRWANTAAITSLSCSSAAASFTIGSTFSLYGIH